MSNTGVFFNYFVFFLFFKLFSYSFAALSKCRELQSRLFKVFISMSRHSFTCCSFEESEPTVSVTRKEKLRLLKYIHMYTYIYMYIGWCLWMTSLIYFICALQLWPYKHTSPLRASDLNVSLVQNQGWSISPTRFRYPAPLSRVAGSSGMAPAASVISHSSCVRAPTLFAARLNGGTAP